MKTALIAYEDPQLLEGVAAVVASTGVEVVQARGARVHEHLRQGRWDVILFGWELGDDVAGLEALAEAKRLMPQVPVLILSPFPDLAYARRATALGAFDYIEVPFTKERLLEAVSAALPETQPKDPMVGFVRRRFLGESRQTLQVVRQIVQYARQSDRDVLITGETGTGKEVAARAIHQAGDRKTAPFLAANCANFKGIEGSELFGHQKGAFTGADADHRGAFERTGDGTLFLDEVQDLSPGTQAQLLRVVEERTYRRVGGEKDLRFTGRIIYASNQDIDEAVRLDRFRQDLFHRIGAHRLHIVPLRERKDDVTPLAEHFLRQYAEGRAIRLSRLVVVLLNEYHFPGNVRELKNVVADGVLRCTGPELLARHVLPRLDAEARVPGANLQQPEEETLFTLTLKDAVVQLEQKYCREYLPWLLRSCNNNLTQAAMKAGIDPKTFRRKWEECGLGKLSTR